MSKKNPSVLWTVGQDLEEADKRTARKNIGLAFVGGDSDTQGSETKYNESTNPIATQKDLSSTIEGLDKAEVGESGKYVEKIKEEDGIVTATLATMNTSIMDVTDADKLKKAPTTGAVKTAIENLDVDDSAVTHKYVSSVSESNGKISVSREFLTLESITPEELHKGKTVGINATTGEIEPQDLSTVDVTEGSTPTNRFVSSIDQASNGQISYKTQQLKAAASDSIGGIKIGYTEPSPNTDKKYAVKLDSEKAYVQVPWENTHYTSKNVICKSASGTDDTAVSTSESAYLNHVENGSVTDYHKISGSGITVAYNNTSKTLTLTSNSGTVTSITAGTGLTTDQTGGGAITSSGTISVNADGTSITVGSSGIKVVQKGTVPNCTCNWGQSPFAQP